MCVEALLVVWSDWRESTESLTHVCLFVEKPLGLIAIGFVLVFKAQLSGAKFYVVAELRAHHKICVILVCLWIQEHPASQRLNIAVCSRVFQVPCSHLGWRKLLLTLSKDIPIHALTTLHSECSVQYPAPDELH